MSSKYVKETAYVEIFLNRIKYKIVCHLKTSSTILFIFHKHLLLWVCHLTFWCTYPASTDNNNLKASNKLKFKFECEKNHYIGLFPVWNKYLKTSFSENLNSDNYEMGSSFDTLSPGISKIEVKT